MQDSAATVTWLSIIAISSVMQTVLLIVAGVLGWQRLRALEQRLRTVERDHIAPTLARLELTLGDMQDAIARLRRADDQLRHVWTTVTDTTTAVIGQVETWAWPLWGVVKGAQAAATVFARSRARRADGRRWSERELDDRDRARFVGEGGETNA